MPLGKYYCDYCDKQFQDTPVARKRHLSGVMHQRNRALWYESVEDSHGAVLLPQDASHVKGFCHHFLRTGKCNYGDVYMVQPPSLLGYPFVVDTSFSGNVTGDHMGISWGNLPPSLRPPSEAGYLPTPFVDWG
ncbi:hypothetical protein HPP92_001218 [Vanilla planifolia]|uniref:Matrin-type domain-containing protein n=1 Tax=Vanilla planifolia TaxID=51239 RepID=A0A835S2X8_VANPL|nr:hypothetical protein HPP92_001218 [Vanilla planifolia]